MPTREKVFETNSSSSHSISINPDQADNYYDTLMVDEDGVVTIRTDIHFGWGNERYNTPEEKASYCILASYHHADPEFVIENYIKPVIKNQCIADKVKIQGLKKAFEGSPNKEEFLESKQDFIGNIDHQSWDTVTYQNLQDTHWLKEFIFHPNSWLFITNDNSGPGPDFYNPPARKWRYTLRFEHEIDDQGTVKQFHINTDDWGPNMDGYPGRVRSQLYNMLMHFGYSPADRYTLSWYLDESNNEIELTYKDYIDEDKDQVQKFKYLIL